MKNQKTKILVTLLTVLIFTSNVPQYAMDRDSNWNTAVCDFDYKDIKDN